MKTLKSTEAPHLVREIMTNSLITLDRLSKVSHALEIMDANRIRHIPIIDERSNIVGILSKRDYSEEGDLDSIPVEQKMTTPVFAVPEDYTIKHAAARMVEKKISALLVTKTNGTTAGIITTDDFLSLLAKLLPE